MSQDERLVDGAQKWAETELTIPSTSGEQVERALAHPNAPGLAVTMHHFGTFDVSHVGSGRKVAGPFQRCGSAMLMAAELAQCLDWTKEAEEIAAELKRRAEEPVPFPGNTSTAKGVTRPMTIGEYVRYSRDPWHDDFPWESPEDDPEERAEKVLRARAASPDPREG